MDSLVYDVGLAVIDRHGNIYEEYSYTLGDIFLNMTEQMDSCYYANKLPQYYEEMRRGTRHMRNMWEIKRKIRTLCKDYNIKAIVAHNARFDVRALNNTIRYITSSKFRYFLPYGVEVWDTLSMSDVIAKQKSYVKFCKENGYMTKHKTPRVRKTAEILYRYISGNNDFKEAHTGLEDVKIEATIFAHCLRQHKRMKKELYKGA
jgi:DNA polymerase III alpha subunit (gram-positive type)